MEVGMLNSTSPAAPDVTRLILRRNLDQQRTARALRRRLREKVENYEREAARLDIRGQTDAARVLRRAASNLKTLTGQGGVAAS